MQHVKQLNKSRTSKVRSCNERVFIFEMIYISIIHNNNKILYTNIKAQDFVRLTR